MMNIDGLTLLFVSYVRLIGFAVKGLCGHFAVRILADDYQYGSHLVPFHYIKHYIVTELGKSCIRVINNQPPFFE